VSLTQGTLISIGKGVVLEFIQLGKECHTRCAIYRQVGKCIMPGEGMFAWAVRGEVVKTGDPISVLEERNL
jgi:molybdopterin adenylyltransferase